MANDSFTVTSSRSWFSRIKDSIKGILVGIVLFVIAFPLLFWNEGRAVKTARGLKEGLAAVVTVGTDRVDPQYEGKLVHLTGDAVTHDVLQDPVFPVSLNAMKLSRKVEMYQWKENSRTTTKKKLGGGEERVTEYTYEKAWSSSHINSSNFHVAEGHQNPPSMLYESASWSANDVKFGAFKLSPGLVSRISNFQNLNLQDDEENSLSARLWEGIKLSNGMLYQGQDPASPQIGDMKISFQYVEPKQTVSLISRQVRDTFEPYNTKAGTTIERLETGVVSSDAMFAQAFRENTMMTWILRIVGFLMMFFGLSMILKPLSVLGDIVPFIGSIIGMGTSIFAGVIALIFSFLTIALGWIVYRPFLGVILLIIAGGLVFLVIKMLRGAKRKNVVEAE